MIFATLLLNLEVSSTSRTQKTSQHYQLTLGGLEERRTMDSQLVFGLKWMPQHALTLVEYHQTLTATSYI